MHATRVKELAAGILNVGVSKIWLSPDALPRAKEALTTEDVRALVSEKLVCIRKLSEQSRGRARQLKEKKKKGRKRGYGKRKGTWKARTKPKKTWMKNVRGQRLKLNELKKQGKVSKSLYRHAYRMVKGNYFRGQRHLEQFIEKEVKEIKETGKAK